MAESEIPRTVLWQKRRRGEIRDAAEAGAIPLLPTGAVEQHGPHLPLDTDSFTSFTVCARAAARVGEFPVLVLPPVWWGLSPYWMVFPGTLTLKAETLTAVIVDIAESVAHHGFRQMVIVNGHGGNDGLTQAAAVRASLAGIEVAALSYWNLIPDALRALSERDAGGIGHAGEMETSIQLHLQPDCVELKEVAPEQCLDLGPWAARFGPGTAGVYTPPNPMADAPHGVYGFAHAGNADKGQRVVETAADALAAFLRRFRRAGAGGAR
ncbi:MAG: creatininase family protein [Candidatus Rokubacteria bacterium]|nr:creatininase family protein [Candidatus Rokubacteria bacterium]